MQLYKKRDFGTLFGDTIAFTRENGKHFYSLYFRIMALPLLAMLVVTFFFYRYFLPLQLGLSSITSENLNLDLIKQNMFEYLISMGAFVVVGSVISMLNFTFTPVYYMLYERYGQDFTAKDMVATMQERRAKIFKFLITIFVAGFLLGLVLLAISCILAVTIIGILALPLVLGFALLSFQNSYMEYLYTDAKAFSAVDFGFRLSLRHFWVSVGTATLYFLMVSMVIGILTSIPYYIYLFATMLGSSNMESAMLKNINATVIFSTVSAIISLISSTLYHLNFGLIYLSNISEEQSIENYSELDQLGQ